MTLSIKLIRSIYSQIEKYNYIFIKSSYVRLQHYIISGWSEIQDRATSLLPFLPKRDSINFKISGTNQNEYPSSEFNLWLKFYNVSETKVGVIKINVCRSQIVVKMTHFPVEKKMCETAVDNVAEGELLVLKF